MFGFDAAYDFREVLGFGAVVLDEEHRVDVGEQFDFALMLSPNEIAGRGAAAQYETERSRIGEPCTLYDGFECGFEFCGIVVACAERAHRFRHRFHPSWYSG